MKNTNNVINFFKGLISSDTTTAKDVAKYQGFIKELEEVDQESLKKDEDISNYKDKIVSLVNHQGSATPPKDDAGNTPRSLEEIAQSVINGGK